MRKTFAVSALVMAGVVVFMLAGAGCDFVEIGDDASWLDGLWAAAAHFVGLS
jgi:hypothetical protein